MYLLKQETQYSRTVSFWSELVTVMGIVIFLSVRFSPEVFSEDSCYSPDMIHCSLTYRPEYIPQHECGISVFTIEPRSQETMYHTPNVTSETKNSLNTCTGCHDDICEQTQTLWLCLISFHWNTAAVFTCMLKPHHVCMTLTRWGHFGFGASNLPN